MHMRIGREIHCQHGPIYRTGWSFDGKVLASAHGNGSLSFWDPETGISLGEHHEHDDKTVRCLAWAKKDYRIASGDTDGKIVIWDFESSSVLRRIDPAHSSRVRSVAWSPDGTRIVSGSSDGLVRTWDSKTGDLLDESRRVFAGGGRPTIYSVKWSPNGKKLASCRDNYSVFWSADDFREIYTLSGHSDRVRSVAWSRDGTRFASCSNDGTIRIWNDENQQNICTLIIEDEDIPRDMSVFCVHFSPDGEFVAAKSTDNTVRLWRIKDGKCLVKLEELCGSGVGENLGGLAFHPHKPYLITLRNNCRNLRMWELDYDSLRASDHCQLIDQGFKSSIERSIEFPPEYHLAGLSILSYFGTIVRHRFPDKAVPVQIKQDKLKVTLVVDTEEGDPFQIEKALNEYGLFLSGHLRIDEYLTDPIQILDLQSQLRFARVQIENQKALIQHKDLAIENLYGLLSQALIPSPPSPIEVNVSQNFTVDAEFHNSLTSFADGLRPLETLLPDSDVVQRVQELRTELREATDKNLKTVKEDGGLPRLKGFMEWLRTAEGKLLKKVRDKNELLQIMQDLAKKYNGIAQWLGWAQVPKPLLGSESKSEVETVPSSIPEVAQGDTK